MLGWLKRALSAKRERRAELAADTEAAPPSPEADPADPSEDPDADFDPEAAADAPLTDELDLHTFLPKECADVVEEYLRAAQEAGFATVRIIHGKGKGTLRRTVHAVLDRHPAVRRYQLAGATRGSWGATHVELLPRPDPAPDPPPT